MPQVKQCAKCTEPADGLDNQHCQLHWEELCAKSFWEMIAIAQPLSESES